MNGDAPIGFDEMLPETEILPTSVLGAFAFPCRDQIPRTIVPPLTNGGLLRSMDNHALAKMLCEPGFRSRIGTDEESVLTWLNRPCAVESMAASDG